jgi:hypothetical protein
MMLKNMKAIVLSSVLIFSAGAAFSSVALGEILPQVIQPTAQPVDDGLVCYMQTSKGATLNLNGLCGSNANMPNRRIVVRQTSERIPPELIRYSNTDNGVACVAIDQQGRPCQAAQ